MGGQFMTLAIVPSSSGAASAALMKPATVSAVGRQDQHAANERRNLVQLVLEPRHDAEVAAAAADGPEQVWVTGLVDGDNHPSARTISAARRLSMVRPYFRAA